MIHVHITIPNSHARGFFKRIRVPLEMRPNILDQNPPNRGIFPPTTSRILIYSDVKFLISILIQVLVDARVVQPSLIPLLRLRPHADHHALLRAGSLN